jgi:hypothetical protein
MASSVRRIGIPTAVMAALFLSSVNPAMGNEDRPKPKSTLKMEFKNLKEKLKYEHDSYKSAMKAREEAREKINEIFKAAIKKATIEARVALFNATTAEQKLVIMNTLKNARTSAVAIRDAALEALGPMPTPPVERRK